MKRYVTIGESQEKLNTNAPHTRGKHKATERAAEKAQATAAQELPKQSDPWTIATVTPPKHTAQQMMTSPPCPAICHWLRRVRMVSVRDKNFQRHS